MGESIAGFPGWIVIGGLILAVSAVVAFVLVFIIGLASPAVAPRNLSLAALAEPRIRRQTKYGRLDTRFDRMVEGTQLGIGPDTAFGWILLAGAIGAVLGYVFTGDVMLALAGALLGGVVPLTVFLALRNNRRKAIQEQLPDGCFQLARSLRSGLNLPLALRETAGYLPTPLSNLYQRLAVALSLGEATGPAVRRVADDAEVTDFDLLAEVLIAHADRGGNLPVMLDKLAAAIRDRNQYRGYFRSVTALSRVTALFLAFALPAAAILYLIFQPDLFANFIGSQVGRGIVAVVVVLEILGLAWLFTLTRREEDY